MIGRRRWPRAAPVAAAGFGPALLSPLVDLVTLLLVALLRSAGEAPPIPPPALGQTGALAPPVSRAEDPLVRGLVVDVGAEGIAVDGHRAGATAAQRLPELAAALEQRPRGPLLLRVDAGVPWSAVERVLGVARAAGFSDVRLVAASAAGL